MLLLLPCLLGCPDLSQVQQLSRTADAGQDSLAAVAADMAASCERQNTYNNRPAGKTDPATPACSAEDLADYRRLGAAIIAEQQVLIEYFDALGELAGKTTAGFAGDAVKLPGEFQNAGFTAAQASLVSSCGTIASATTTLATAGYRGRKVRDLLLRTDPAVQQATHQLADLIDPDPEPDSGGSARGFGSYMGQLVIEDNLIGRYYEIPLIREGTYTPTGMLLQTEYRQTLAAQQRRKDAARAYRRYMLALGAAHARLAAGAGRFSRADVQRLAGTLSGPAHDLISAVSQLHNDLR